MEAKLLIHEVTAGAFVFPTGYQAASLAYLVELSKEVRFQKKVDIQMRHGAKLRSKEESGKLIFVSASSTPQQTERGDQVYTFKIIEGGEFDQFDPHGKVALNHFSIIAIAGEGTLDLSEAGILDCGALLWSKFNAIIDL